MYVIELIAEIFSDTILKTTQVYINYLKLILNVLNTLKKYFHNFEQYFLGHTSQLRKLFLISESFNILKFIFTQCNTYQRNKNKALK